MKKKSIWAVILSVVVVLVAVAIIVILAMSGCEARNELNKLKTEVEEMQKIVEEKQAIIEQLQNTTPPAPDTSVTVVAVNSTIGGETIAVSDGKTALTADAVLAEGQSVDHWELNGEVQENSAAASFTFTATETTVVKAVLTQEKRLTTVNCSIRFLNAKGAADGDKLTEFVFDKPYKNPVTQADVTDGTISFQIQAEVPSGKAIDYWKINGVEYHITDSSFTVIGLDESTEYEVVLKEKAEVYYTVTCLRCNYGGKTEFRVKAGTTITINGDSGQVGWWYLDGGQKINASPAASWTLKVDKDYTIEFWEIIN